ncbi:MAG: 2,4-dienoyl-CoA reductase-like NADH-dependent reductase (Old Yellow Enzyme family) [Natrialbaceae archaeon]|jgi:2,4-dienoyl-CoA reductase-like NADH-dependent reductase (Old Yellow Enzyme family)
MPVDLRGNVTHFPSPIERTTMTAELFRTFEIRDVTARNRVMVSPMCQYSCERDGLATDWHHVHYGSRATGGAGIVMTEATAVQAEGRITPSDLGLWSDGHAKALAETTEFIRQRNATPAVQLAHAGRKASKSQPWNDSKYLSPKDGGWEVLSPSGDPYPTDRGTPAIRAMSRGDIEGVIESFATAAERAIDAGFEVLEVHAAHGYLLHQFLSPVTNDREDAYGGDFDGRTRLVREVVGAIRERVPDGTPVFVRVSATDWLPDRESWTIEDTVQLARDLSTAVDLIEVSAGGIHPDQEPPSSGPGFLVPFSERVTEAVDDVFVGAVGKITAPEQAEELIRNDRADLAIVGREHLRDPYFTLHAAEALDATDQVEWPVQYRRAV